MIYPVSWWHLTLDKGKILEVYKKLIGGAFPEYSRILEKAGGESLGKFLTQLTQLALEEGLKDLENVRIRNTRFDRFNGVTETITFLVTVSVLICAYCIVCKTCRLST